MAVTGHPSILSQSGKKNNYSRPEKLRMIRSFVTLEGICSNLKKEGEFNVKQIQI